MTTEVGWSAEAIAQNAAIDSVMRPLMARWIELRRRIHAREQRSSRWSSWTEPLPAQDPLVVELCGIDAALALLRDSRPVHPIHAEMRAEISEALRGRPTQRIIELFEGDD